MAAVHWNKNSATGKSEIENLKYAITTHPPPPKDDDSETHGQ
jgi:hypothetical protein